jgi:hypothetical protein
VLENNVAPPVALIRMLADLRDAGLRSEIDELLAAKAAGTEADAFPVSSTLRDFIDGERAAVEAAAADLTFIPPDLAPLDALFRQTLDRLEPAPESP